jgi:hypothetical protein
MDEIIGESNAQGVHTTINMSNNYTCFLIGYRNQYIWLNNLTLQNI